MSEETEKRQAGSTSIVWGCSSVVPWCSLLPRCLHEFQERAGNRRPSQYWQNTPGHILQVSTAPFWKNCSPILWMCCLKCLQTAVSYNFVAYFFWLIFCLLWWIVYGQRLCQSATQAKFFQIQKNDANFHQKLTYIFSSTQSGSTIAGKAIPYKSSIVWPPERHSIFAFLQVIVF